MSVEKEHMDDYNLKQHKEECEVWKQNVIKNHELV